LSLLGFYSQAMERNYVPQRDLAQSLGNANQHDLLMPVSAVRILKYTRFLVSRIFHFCNSLAISVRIIISELSLKEH
jgi:hypothetical protein